MYIYFLFCEPHCMGYISCSHGSACLANIKQLYILVLGLPIMSYVALFCFSNAYSSFTYSISESICFAQSGIIILFYGVISFIIIVCGDDL
ncbi:hypothetical protein FKM82_002809 [Ascaphus truei]